MIRKIFLIALVALFAISAALAMDLYTGSSQIVARDSSDWNVNAPLINFVNQNPDPAVPGRYVELRWKIENVGDTPTDQIIFELVPEYPFTLDSDARQYLGTSDSYQIGEDAYIVYYRVKVDSDAVEGNNRIKVRYTKDDGKVWYESSYYVRVEEQDFTIAVDPVKTTPQRVRPGEVMKLELGVQNLASSDIRDVKVKVNVEKVDMTQATVVRTELPFTPVGSSDEKVFKNILPNEKKTVSFDLAVSSDAESKVHKLPITITYSNLQGEQYEKEVIIGVEIFEVPEYFLNLESNDIYKSGQKGSFTISISNTGLTEMKFLTMRLIGSDDYKIISPSTIYMGNLESDDYESAEFEIYADTQKESIPISVELSYRDEYNKRYDEVKNDIFIPLYGPEEAVLFGLEPKKSPVNMIVSAIIGLILLVFWIFMLIDAINSGNDRVKKTVWIILIIFGLVIGALVYYLFGRKKNLGRE